MKTLDLNELDQVPVITLIRSLANKGKTLQINDDLDEHVFEIIPSTRDADKPESVRGGQITPAAQADEPSSLSDCASNLITERA